MSMHDAAVFIYLLLAIPVMLYGISVLFFWGPEAATAWRVPCEKRSGVDWLILGVAINFFGTVMDNLYWTIPWTCDFIESPQRDFWMSLGVYFNIPFRQVADIAAGYCHVKEAVEYGKQKNRVLAYLLWGSGTSMFLFGVVSVCVKFGILFS